MDGFLEKLEEYYEDDFKFPLSEHLAPEKWEDINERKMVQSDDRTIGRMNTVPTPERTKTKELSFRKNSLKFCRRLCKHMLLFLQEEANVLLDPIFRLFSKIIETQIITQKIAILDSNASVELHRQVLNNIWGELKNIFSHYKNNKICLVTFAEWQMIFSKDGFGEKFDNASNVAEEMARVYEFQNAIEQQTFIGFYKLCLFSLNRMLMNIVILQEILNDREFLQRNPNAGDFMILSNHPHLYRHYNHCKGKFAVECCGRCKVCRAIALPTDFKEQLAKAREKIAAMKIIYSPLFELKEEAEELQNQIMSIFSDTLVDNLRPELNQ